METKKFIKKLAEAIEIEDVKSLNTETKFRELDEWSSLSIMLLIAFFDEEFNKQIGEQDIRQAKTIEDLYKLDLDIKSGQVDHLYAFELFLIKFERN